MESAKPGAELPPLALIVPALGCGERGMGKQLLLIRHRLQQGGQIGMHPRGSPTKARKAFPLLRHHSPTGQETQRLSQRRTGLEVQAGIGSWPQRG